ncbi:YqzL family protein [Alicyclobacillus fastidiosus]|uniref:YqzL family protein n=1 Tax=Alicyclobacillus fastidiosus TaxID=392011 RepID=A0ABV5ACM5_9BACL|nr:YqzL family protein [Alicyclobacillus fastidiosus]WEH11349.1 YqzL family protein [Alicyclobacillus fastidiosus]
MRDYTWQMFELTGDIDAYLLYRAADGFSPEIQTDALDEAATDEPEAIMPQ